jgi:hypothetical protein
MSTRYVSSLILILSVVCCALLTNVACHSTNDDLATSLNELKANGQQPNAAPAPSPRAPIAKMNSLIFGKRQASPSVRKGGRFQRHDDLDLGQQLQQHTNDDTGVDSVIKVSNGASVPVECLQTCVLASRVCGWTKSRDS